jgi:DNA-binding LacI/PurR family transcriptional regulator
MLDRQAAGIIFVSGLHSVVGQDHSHYTRLTSRGMPVVAIDGLAPGLDFACVSTDDGEAVELSVRHLTQLGHTHLGLAIADRDHVPGARKEEVFLARVTPDRGLTGTVARSIYSLEGGTTAATELIVAGATAIICASDVMALGAVRAARKLGMQVPQDLSVVGFDDSMFMPLVDPPITTIRQPVEAMAKAAANLLLGQISGRGTPHGEILFEPELVVRETTGPAHVDS